MGKRLGDHFYTVRDVRGHIYAQCSVIVVEDCAKVIAQYHSHNIEVVLNDRIIATIAAGTTKVVMATTIRGDVVA